MLRDATSVEAGSILECDLCVVGAGAAGIAMADRLTDAGLSVILLESGGFDVEHETQNLFSGENIGHPYYALDACRFRQVGGSTTRWGGWCRPLDDDDFARREWLPLSGWPIAEAELTPYYAEVARLLEIASPTFSFDALGNVLRKPLALEGTDFRNILYQFSPKTNFALKYRDRLRDARNVTTILHANVTDMRLAADSSRVDLVQVSTLEGHRFSVRPRELVLAAGGIENARLLLTARGDRQSGLGNEHDNVGRYFMEHLNVPMGHLAASPAIADRSFYGVQRYGESRVRGFIVPRFVAQRRRELLACSIAIEPQSYVYGTPLISAPSRVLVDPVNMFRTLERSPLRAAAPFVRDLAKTVGHAPTRLRTWRAAREARSRAAERANGAKMFSLFVRAEQAPDRSSRVVLGDRRDALGLPKAALDWRVGALDLDSATRWLEAFDAELNKRGYGSVVFPLEGWEAKIIGGPHHIGTTRMSATPAHGVVDENCRLHTVANVHVAGASVFATSGYANPTFTVVALALRLADRLRRTVHGGVRAAMATVPDADMRDKELA